LRIAGAAGWAFTGIINGQLIDALNTNVIFAIAAISMLLTFIFMILKYVKWYLKITL